MKGSVFVSYMRTLVPAAAGLVLGLAARFGLDLDDATTTAVVTTAAMAGYYAVWRGLEELARRIAWVPLQVVAGLMLGWARPPDYSGPDDRLTALLRDIRRE